MHFMILCFPLSSSVPSVVKVFDWEFVFFERE
jgi:hypothetical protein